MTYYQLPKNNRRLSDFQLFLQTGHFPLNWHFKLKELRRARPRAPVLLAFFVLFVVSYVSFVLIRVCDGQARHVCTDNFLLQPPILGRGDTSKEIFKENFFLRQNGTNLLRYIRENHIFPPPRAPLKLQRGANNYTVEMKSITQFVSSMLKTQKGGGFFVEANSEDGEGSKTLMLEKEGGWTGVLIEANPKAFSDLLRRERKAFLADVCLSTSDKPQEVIEGEVTLPLAGVNQLNLPALQVRAEESPEHHSISHPKVTTTIQEDTILQEIELKCLPIFSILSALNQTTIDFFSLNAHGAELKVLQTIPFDSVFIKRDKRKLVDFMASKGYRHIRGENIGLKSHIIFVHTNIFR